MQGAYITSVKDMTTYDAAFYSTQECIKHTQKINYSIFNTNKTQLLHTVQCKTDMFLNRTSNYKNLFTNVRYTYDNTKPQILHYITLCSDICTVGRKWLLMYVGRPVLLNLWYYTIHSWSETEQLLVHVTTTNPKLATLWCVVPRFFRNTLSAPTDNIN